MSLESERKVSCRVCGRPKDNHPYRHAFQGPDSGSLIEKEQPPPAIASGPIQGSPGNALRGDPVLRMVLIRAGVITVDQLSQVEAELRATGFAIT